eukprot:s582_g19.t1
MAGSALLRSSAIGGLVLAALQLPWCPRLSVSKQLLAGCLLGYLASVLDGSEKRPGCRRSPWLLRVVQRFWNQVLPRLFNIDCSLEDEEELRKCGHCVVAVHPHGVLSLGHYLVISGFHPDLERALPASRRCALSAGVLFKLPGVRELALGLGCVDAHRDVAKRCLSHGLSISVVPGGEREQLLAQRGKVEQLVLAQRQGFVRLALQHGVPMAWPVWNTSPEPSKTNFSAHSGLTSAGAMALDLQGPDSTESRPRPPFSQRLAAQLAVAMPELGWSVCEPLFMPLLLELEVPYSLLAVCWVISPAAGLVLQPCVGALSDKYGRRPFILLFGFMAVVGLTVTPLLAELASKAIARPLAIVAFGLADVSHDMLVTPTRAQMNDVFDPDTAESRSAVIGGIAKTFAMLCAILLPRAGAFLTVAVVAFFSTTAQLFWRPEKAALAIQDSLAEVQQENAASDRVRTYPAGFWQLWLLQCAGWLSVCTWSFYFTSVWAEIKGARSSKSPGFEPAVREATGYLLLGSFVFLGAGGALSRLSNLCTEQTSLCASVVVMMLTLIVLCMAHLNSMLHWLAAALVVFAMPVAYQILANTPFKWLESQPGFDETQRGWLTGIFNTTLAVAQAFTAVLSGPIVAAAGGRLWAAYAAAFLFDVLVLVLVLVMRLRALSSPRELSDLNQR